MNRVLAVVEGQTEQSFVREVLGPALANKGVFLAARLVGKPGQKGGIGSWEKARRDIEIILKGDPSSYCTTMFDYYRLPSDWPGKSSSTGHPFRQAVARIEQATHDEARAMMGTSWNPSYFIPYIQTHEFEALLFSGTDVLAVTVQRANVKGQFDAILKTCGEAEAIDDDPQTAPSKRILKLVPHYEKVVHGTIAAQQIGLDRMKAACPHFRNWLAQLENVATTE